MASRTDFFSAAWLFALTALTGCAGSDQFAGPSADARHASMRYSADGSTLLASEGAPYSPASEPPSMPSQLASRITNSVKGTVQTVGEKVSDALEPDPRVIPAEDPASLASMPRELNPSIYIQSALWSERHGNAEAAHRQYEKAFELAPNDVNTAIYYARFLDRRGDVGKAIEIYHRALAVEPRHPLVLNDLGLCHARQGRFQQAVPPLQGAVAAQPGNARYRNNLANVLIAAGQADAAVDTLQQIYPPAIAHFNVGYLLYRQQKTDEAVRYLMRAVQLDPNLPSAREMLAQIETRQRTAARPQSQDHVTVASVQPLVGRTPVGEPSQRWTSSVDGSRQATQAASAPSGPATRMLPAVR